MKISRRIIPISIIFIFIIALSINFTYAWIKSQDNSIKAEISGKVVQEYFHSGTGTQSDPFVITRPIHYYHMVEFYQRLTELRISSANITQYFGTSFIYFQIGANDLDNSGEYKVYKYNSSGDVVLDNNGNQVTDTELNMAYYSGANALMPIGSSEIPFYGVFDGKGLTISNLNIVASEVIPNPNGQGTITRKTADIGVFGYVRYDSGSNSNPGTTLVKDVYFKGVNISLVDVDKTSTSSTHSISEVSHTDTAYVGYVAGHIRYNDQINDKVFTNVFINDCTITGGNAATSNFGLIGRVDNQQGVEIETLTETIENNLDNGNDTGWGGSFDSSDYTALGYSIHPTNSGTHTKTVSGAGGYVMAISASTNANPENNNVIYRLRDGSYVPLKFNSEGKAATTNTGYLVGSNVGTGVNASPKISSYRLNNIGNALGNTAYTNMANTYKNTTNISYDDSKLEILTYYNGSWVRIRDEHNYNNNSTNTQIRNYTRTDVETMGLQRYTDARNALQESLTGSSYVHGIHFDNNQVSSSNKLTIPANTAIVNGTAYTSTYEVPKGSINFNLLEAGYITFFAGTYNSSQVNLNFFSLNQVFRSGGSITNIKQITQIYTNTDANGEPYVYKYSDNTYSSGTRGTSIFNLSTILSGNAPVVNMLYYFELPVNSGEYAMGVAGSTQGAYMLYLDIGTNGGDEVPEVIDTVGNDLADLFDIEFRDRPDPIDNHSLLQIAVDAPDNASDKFDIKVEFDKTQTGTDYENGLYIITINNSSGSDITLTVYLYDNDSNSDTKFPYAYKIIANGNVVVNNVVEYWKVCTTHTIPSS